LHFYVTASPLLPAAGQGNHHFNYKATKHHMTATANQNISMKLVIGSAASSNKRERDKLYAITQLQATTWMDRTK
jgi:hypothetical protein